MFYFSDQIENKMGLFIRTYSQEPNYRNGTKIPREFSYWRSKSLLDHIILHNLFSVVFSVVIIINVIGTHCLLI